MCQRLEQANRLRYRTTFVERHHWFGEQATSDVFQMGHRLDSFDVEQSNLRSLPDDDQTFLRQHGALTILEK